MARPTTKPRVPTLNPEHEALRFVRLVSERLRMASAMVHPVRDLGSKPSDAQLKSTALYRVAEQIALYAVHGDTAALSSPPSQLLERLSPLMKAPLEAEWNISQLLESIDPDEETDPFKLLIAAAVAREQLAAGTIAVTSSQLAILAGVTRRHVGAEIREGKLEADIAGRRGTAGAALIRPEEARRWLRSRG